MKAQIFNRSSVAGRVLFGGLSLLLASGCAVSVRTAGEVNQIADDTSIESLNGVLWTQTAVEYAGVTRSVYALASIRLQQALADPSWTASLEQLAQGGYESLPPAVIVDVDETVLDNSAYQARLIQAGTTFASSSWAAWVLEEEADPIPGALAFIQDASFQGITVFYVTNRGASLEDATRSNLREKGFPVREDVDVVLTKSEQPDWASSDKTSRRSYVADRYRILLLIGDNYGDFSSASRGTVAERNRTAGDFLSFWGKKWLVLPNPQYGSWEGALFDYRYSLSSQEQRQIKKSGLKTGINLNEE